MKKKFISILVALIVFTLGVFMIARAAAPKGIKYDPADEGHCEAFGIEMDTTQVDTIFLHPETILNDPDTFLGRDTTSLLLANRHVELNDPLDADRWVRQIEKIANLPMDEREQQDPYTFSREVIAGKETFCKIAVPQILSYLPGGVEISTTYYQAALDPVNTGFSRREGIVMGLSHPMYSYAEKLLKQGSASIYNIMVHELFHQGYDDAWLWQIEKPLENSALRFLVRGLQNDGMAVNAAYQVTEYYPSSLDIVYPLHRFKPYVRHLVGQVNRVFERVEAKTMDELNQDVSRLYRRNVHYIVGGYMAGRIESQLGKEALVKTVEVGPLAFIQAYNSVAEDGMDLHIAGLENETVSIFQDLRSAALEGDLAGVRKNLEAIRANPSPSFDVESDGYLIYNTGYILLREDHLNLAEDVFQLGIALSPHVGSIYVGLGDVYAQQGDISAAIENYQRALELEPRNIWVAVILHQLEYEE